MRKGIAGLLVLSRRAQGLAKSLQLIWREVNLARPLALDTDVTVGDLPALASFLCCLLPWSIKPVGIVVVTGIMATWAQTSGRNSGVPGRHICPRLVIHRRHH